MQQPSFSWKELASLIVGGAICLPVIMVGHKLCSTYGLFSALAAIGIGNGVLLALALGMLSMSLKNRKITAENAQEAFGIIGAKYFAGILLFAKTCWFAIQLNMMSLSLQSLISAFGLEISTVLINAGLGIIIVSVALYGIRALSTLSTLSMPVLIGTMAYAVFATGGISIPIREFPFSFEGTSLAIATALTAVIDMPTYFRLSRTYKDGLIAVLIIFAVALPVIESVGVYLAYKNPGNTILETLYQENNTVWNLWIALFLLLAGWTTNNTNLYSATVCSSVIVPQIPEKKRTVLVGSIATLLALFGILEHFALFLQMLGVFVGSMGAVILTRYILSRFTIIMDSHVLMKMHFGAFFGGVVMGLLCLNKIFVLSQLAIVDTFCVAMSLTLLSNFAFKNTSLRKYESVNN